LSLGGGSQSSWKPVWCGLLDAEAVQSRLPNGQDAENPCSVAANMLRHSDLSWADERVAAGEIEVLFHGVVQYPCRVGFSRWSHLRGGGEGGYGAPSYKALPRIYWARIC